MSKQDFPPENIEWREKHTSQKPCYFTRGIKVLYNWRRLDEKIPWAEPIGKAYFDDSASCQKGCGRWRTSCQKNIRTILSSFHVLAHLVWYLLRLNISCFDSFVGFHHDRACPHSDCLVAFVPWSMGDKSRHVIASDRIRVISNTSKEKSFRKSRGGSGFLWLFHGCCTRVLFALVPFRRFLWDSRPSSSTLGVEKIAFSSLTLKGRRRNYSLTGLEPMFGLSSHGIYSEARRCASVDKLELSVSNCFVRWRKCRKAWPKKILN